MDALIITAAAVGAELSPEEQPNLPLTPEDVARDARDCESAGASIYHLHVRDAQGRPTMEVARFRECHDAITSSTDLIVQFTTGGAVGDSEDDRIAPLELRPEMATLTTGTVNFGDDVFMNPAPFVRRLYGKMLSVGVTPEYEIFDSGMVPAALGHYDALGATHHRHFDFVLSVPGGMQASPAAIDFLVSLLPADATWSATGIGRSHASVAAEAIERGGHVRTGFEDVRYVEAGVLAESNAQLVERVVTIAGERGRAVASPREARTTLGLVPPSR